MGGQSVPFTRRGGGHRGPAGPPGGLLRPDGEQPFADRARPVFLRDGETAAAQLAPTWPSLEAMTHVLHRHTSLGISSDFAMGEQYARTLREWRAGFLAATDDTGQLGFGRAFQRMRDLYLAYSEAGFRSG